MTETKPVMRLTNSSSKAVELWLEPLGDKIVFPAKTTVQLSCSQPDSIEEIVIAADRWTLYGLIDRIEIVEANGRLRLLW